MDREEKKRTFEFETLALPPLKMILVEAENNQQERSTKKGNKKVDKNFEETVIRIINKLIAKD